MKREFLKNLGIADDAIDQIMAEHGKSVSASQQTIQSLTTERDGYKAQLDTASAEIQKYKDMDIDGIRRSASEWENKYRSETAALTEKLKAAEYAHTVERAVSGYRFSSGAAQKQFIADLTAKGLPVQDGKLMGLDDYVAAYQEADPQAFVPEGQKQPLVTAGGGGAVTPTFESSLRAAFGLKADGK